ncbi:MAG: HlyD family efflux transporter periplasmic adaptor subunit [Paracoccaceae bacterium]
MTHTIDDAIARPAAGARSVIWLVAATVACFVAWAMVAAVDEIVRAEGDMVSSSRPQIIQNLEGGILAELFVAEGQEVEPGQLLGRLRGTQFSTQLADLEEQIAAAEIRRLRLEAEIAGADSFDIPQAYAQLNPAIATSEAALLRARQSDYQARVAGARTVLEEAREELSVMEDLLTREIVALIEVTPRRRAFSDASNVLSDLVTTAELERAAAYSETLRELSTLRQDARLARDRLERTEIRSPMRGIVNAVAVTTIGGVVRPGEEIFQIIPLDEELFVEARVAPEDIANVVPGQRATLKMSAYDYTIHGSLSGEVLRVSADTFEDERRSDLPPHYRVTVAVETENLTERQRAIELRPGLRATVELHTGSKTIWQYLTKPLYRGSEALREP